MTIDIRQLTLGELPLIADLDTSSSTQIYDLLQPGTGAGLILEKRSDQPVIETASWGANEIASRMELWRKNYAEGCKFWGAFCDRRLIGFLLLSSEKVNGVLEIYSIFVDRKSRDKGVGTRLVAAAEKCCEGAGVKGLYVSTTLDGTATDFYLKNGFRLVGLHSRCYRHQWGQATFIKELGAPNNQMQAARNPSDSPGVEFLRSTVEI